MTDEASEADIDHRDRALRSCKKNFSLHSQSREECSAFKRHDKICIVKGHLVIKVLVSYIIIVRSRYGCRNRAEKVHLCNAVIWQGVRCKAEHFS